MISGMARTSLAVELSAADQTRLQQWQSAHGTPQQVALRCRLVLAAAADSRTWLSLRLRSQPPYRRTVAGASPEAGIDAVWETQAGRGRKPQYDLAQCDALIAATLQTKPKGMTHWSCRLMARAQGVSKNTVNRLWQLHNLKPHLSRTFKLSRDPKFVEKLTDVVGLYLNPPQKALVLCIDEEEPDSGAGSDTARTAVEEGSVWHDDPRLQAPRHDHAICRFKFVGRQGDRAVPGPTPPSRVPEIPAAVGPGVSWGAATASGAGQLRHAQDTAGASLAENPSAVCAPLHPHQFELAEPGGAVVLGS